MNNWTKLTIEEKLTILSNVAESKGIVDNAVEKDYWVSMVLRAIFTLPYATAFVFKGGTRIYHWRNEVFRRHVAQAKRIFY